MWKQEFIWDTYTKYYTMHILVYMYMDLNTPMHVDFFTIFPPYLLVQVLHEGEKDGDLTSRSKV